MIFAACARFHARTPVIGFVVAIDRLVLFVQAVVGFEFNEFFISAGSTCLSSRTRLKAGGLLDGRKSGSIAVRTNAIFYFVSKIRSFDSLHAKVKSRPGENPCFYNIAETPSTFMNKL